MHVRFLANILDVTIQKVGGYVPFSVRNIVWRSLDKKGKRILDVGCGNGRPMKFINRNRQFEAIGIDIFEPYVEQCRKEGFYNDCIVDDIRNLNQHFEKKSVDIVLCLEVVEHLDKEDGIRLIKDMEKIARRQVIISTPVGTFRQTSPESKANPHQRHRATWSPREFRAMGYKVRGSGVYRINDERSLLSCFPLKPLGYLIYVLAGPFVYFIPKISCHMVCTKNLLNKHSASY